MFFDLPPLPYKKSALAPAMSKKTVELHHDKHLKGYLDKLNAFPAIADAPEGITIEQVLVNSANHRKTGARKAMLPPDGLYDNQIFNMAAQVYNHAFFFHCLTPSGGGEPRQQIVCEMLEGEFGGWKPFRDVFTNRAMELFGSGWVWLAADDESVSVLTGENAETPFVYGMAPILTLDMWEHAYYLDYKNDKKKYIDSFFDDLLNWDFVADNLDRL